MVAMVYYTLTTKQRSNGMKDTILDCLAFVGAVALVVVVVGMCECPGDCGDSVEWDTAHYAEWCERN